jgi:hypothetical protein
VRRLAFLLLFLPAVARAQAPKPVLPDEVMKLAEEGEVAIHEADGNEVAAAAATKALQAKLDGLAGRPVAWRLKVSRVTQEGDWADVSFGYVGLTGREQAGPRLGAVAGLRDPEGSGRLGCVRVPVGPFAASLRRGQELTLTGRLDRIYFGRVRGRARGRINNTYIAVVRDHALAPVKK